MFFHQIQIDKVTPEQIAFARTVIPSLEMRPIETREEALVAAFEGIRPFLKGYEYVSEEKNLVVLSDGEKRTSQNANFVQENETGWRFELVVFGD